MELGMPCQFKLNLKLVFFRMTSSGTFWLPYFLLWMLTCRKVAALNSKYDLPRMRCPVAYSMDTAFFFKTIDPSEDLGARHQLYLNSKNDLESVIR